MVDFDTFSKTINFIVLLMKIIVSVKDWSSMGLDLYYLESIPFLSYKCKSLTTLKENLSL